MDAEREKDLRKGLTTPSRLASIIKNVSGVLLVMKFEAITSIIVDIVCVVGIIICRYRLEAW